ncbi:hypothetical protein ACFLS1_05515 [Verrucomicrobiota bacterium]
MNKQIRNFLLILAGAVVSSVLGAIFAVVIAKLSPEFIIDIFGRKLYPIRFAASMGMLWGLFIGAGTMAFCLGVSAIANWFKPKQKEE